MSSFTRPDQPIGRECLRLSVIVAPLSILIIGPFHDLRRALALCSHDVDVCKDTQLWQNADLHLIAFATIWLGTKLIFCVYPYVRADVLEANIIDWARARSRELGRRFGERAILCVPVCVHATTWIALLERRGFVPVAW